MAELGYGHQNTTVTTVSSRSTTVQTDIRFDKSYINTVPGVLKIIQLILSLLGFVFMSASAYSMNFRASFFTMVAMFAFWFTGILLVLYLFHIIEKLYKIPWLMIELVYCGVIAAFYFLASIFCASWAIHSTFGLTAFVGFCATAAYAYDAWLKFVDYSNGELAQGTRVVSTHKTVSTVSSPTGAPITIQA